MPTKVLYSFLDNFIAYDSNKSRFFFCINAESIVFPFTPQEGLQVVNIGLKDVRFLQFPGIATRKLLMSSPNGFSLF